MTCNKKKERAAFEKELIPKYIKNCKYLTHDHIDTIQNYLANFGNLKKEKKAQLRHAKFQKNIALTA